MCGLPGSGKTTLAKRLAPDVPAIRLCPDEWMVSLAVDLYDDDFRDRLENTFWAHAQDLLRGGQSVILEYGFWTRADRDQKRLGARALGAAVELHYLDVPADELWRRVDARNASAGWTAAPITRELMRSWLPFFDAPGADELALFDPASGNADDDRF